MIGLGSYSFFWEQSAKNPKALSLAEVFNRTADLGLQLFQICDYEQLEKMSDLELKRAADCARELGLEIELGTKGVESVRLAKFLELAKIFDAKLVRTMTHNQVSKPEKREVIEILLKELKLFEDAGVVLALETYEQIPSTELVEIVASVDSPNLGICLDPANVVASLEHPERCIEVCAPYIKNIHAKDFAFTRQEGWVGFVYSGAVMGEGLHDYPNLVSIVKPRERGINEIIEHWLPWQGSIEKTVEIEKQWTQVAIEYLRSVK
jgi:sugar phosphate isomerase/epimerase